MVHQDFEKYAQERQMNGLIADIYQKFFEEWIDYKNSQLRVLDFGCGDGKYFDFFRKFFKEENIFGVEISRIRIERCKNKGWKNVLLIKKLERLPFFEEYFDLINFDQVIEHISENEINFYLLELTRVLKKNGKMIIITPNYPIKRIYDFLNAFPKQDFKRILDDPTHITHYNFKKLNNLFKRYFIEVKLEPTGGLFYRWFKKKFFSHKIIGLCVK